MASCICAARHVLQAFQRWRRSKSPLVRTALQQAYPEVRKRQPAFAGRLPSQAAEDREGVPGGRLPDDLAAGLHGPVQARREGVRVLLRGRLDDEELGLPHGPVPVRLERLGKRLGLFAGGALDPNLPGRVAVVQLFLFPGLALGLVVPALLGLEPVLDPARARRAAEGSDLRLDHGQGALGLGPRRRVDEARGSVAGDCETLPLELPRELASLVVELDTEPLEQRVVHVFDVDADAPVVGHYAAILPDRVTAPPRKSGQPAPRMRQASTSAGSATTPSARRCWASSATASSARSRISSSVRRSPAPVGVSGKRSGHDACIVSSTCWATAGPTISRSTDGAIGIPSDRIASSTSSTVLPPAIASARTVVMRVSRRLTTKPGASPTSTPRFFSFLTTSHAVASWLSVVRGVRTISTSGITATGLKKCRPTSAPIPSTESEDVFVARIASGAASRASASTSRFASISSNTASSTTSQPSNSSQLVPPSTIVARKGFTSPRIDASAESTRSCSM